VRESVPPGTALIDSGAEDMASGRCALSPRRHHGARCRMAACRHPAHL